MSFLYVITIYPLELIYKYIYLACVFAAGSYGIGLIVLSLVTFIVFVPLKEWAKKVGDKEREIQDVLAPQMAEIKTETTGARRQEEISELYKRYGYHPVMAVRSAIGAGLQIPFLMAAYYMISGLKGLEGQSFLFIKDLSRPDGLLFGLNVLPILMTLINFATTFTTKDMRPKDRIQAVVIALLFFALLYTAPSALLIYWTCNNILYLSENVKCVKTVINKVQRHMAKSVVFVFSKLIKPNLTEIVLSFTFCVIIPFNFYIQNNTSIEVTFSQMFPWLMIAFVPVCVIFISIEFMLGMINEKWSFVFKALLSGILICSIIQAFFVTVDYGVFDGSTIDWKKFKIVSVWNTAVWLAVLCGVFFIINKNRKYIIDFTIYSLIVVMSISFYNYITTPILEKKMTFFSDEHLFKVSKNKNMIVLILDAFDTEVFHALLKKYPENKKKLSGFIYYPDCAGSYPRTVAAMPQIITGKWYKNEEMYQKYIDEAYKDNKFFNLVKNDYDIDIYTSSKLSSVNTIARNLKYGEGSYIKSKRAFFSEYSKISLFKVLPHILKKYIKIDDQTGVKSFEKRSSKKFVNDNFLFIENLKKNGLTAVSDRNSFKIIHLRGAHPILNMDRNSNMVDYTKNTIYEHSQGALNIAYLYIDYLKKLKVYDKTVLVIMADHGIQRKMRTPLMLIKPLTGNGKKALHTDNTPISYKNLQATFADLMGMPYQEFGIPFRIKQKQKRFFYWHSNAFNAGWTYLPPLYEYEITGKSNNPESWKLTGKVYGLDNTYNIGSTIRFHSKGNSVAYIENGFFISEAWGTWTDENEAVMKMQVRKGKNKKLFLNVMAEPYLGKEQIVTVFANNHEIAKWHVTQKNVYQAEIPAFVMQTNELKLVFRISDAISHHSGGNFGIGFIEAVIKDKPIQTSSSCEVPLKKKLSFKEASVLKCSLVKGFSVNEDWGTWTDGDEAVMKMQVRKGENKKLFLTVTAVPYLGKTLKEQVVTVFANNHEIAKWHMDKHDIYRAEIPASVMMTNDLKLVFKISAPHSPLSEGLSSDARKLGVGLLEMVLKK